MAKILLINGPNLNMLGIREPEKYGRVQLSTIEEKVAEKVKARGYSFLSFQSNSEGELVDFIQREGIESVGILINAGAYTHTSVAIRDAILAVNCPFVEVHLSNIFKREKFRHVSYLTDIAVGIISGFGMESYYLAVDAMISYIENSN